MGRGPMRSITARWGMRTGRPTIHRTRCAVGDVFDCAGDCGTVDACLAAQWDSARAEEAQALRLFRPLLKRARQRAQEAAGEGRAPAREHRHARAPRQRWGRVVRAPCARAGTRPGDAVDTRPPGVPWRS